MRREDVIPFFMENSLDIVLLFQKDGVISYVNKEAIEALEWEKLRGHNIAEVFPNCFHIEDGQLELECTLPIVKETLVAYRENRTCFPVMAKIEEYEDGYICSAFNISQWVMMEKKMAQVNEELEMANKIKSEFVANVTHELRTPVNGISGNTRELETLETDEKKLRLLDLIQQGCKNMNAIINNILDFSKLEAGKFTLDKQEFEFEHMIEFIKGNHRNKLVEKGLDFVVNISQDVPKRIIGDELRIGQILNNLLSNASKFTSVGKITLEVIKTAQYDNRVELFFMVIDTGIGISKADQDKLFKSFSQVDASISRKYGGTGLGLNICKQLVELMDGGIQVESVEGKGSTFTFHIMVEVPEDEIEENVEPVNVDDVMQKIKNISAQESTEGIWQYGTPENKEELQKKMTKLILCVDMENWEKAEMFMDTVRQLTEEAPKEVKTAVLRLKMAVQKANQDKAADAYSALEFAVQHDDLGGNLEQK